MRAVSIVFFFAFSAILFSCGAGQDKEVGNTTIDTNATIVLQAVDSTKKSTEVLDDTILLKQPVTGGEKYYKSIKGDAAIKCIKTKKRSTTLIHPEDTSEVSPMDRKMKVFVGHDPG